MSKLLATDLDGTLFYPKRMRRCICKKNVKFLRKWIDDGNSVVLISSRSYEFCERLKKEIDRPVDFICCTGGQIFVDDKQIKNKKIDNKDLRKMLSEVDETYKPVSFLMTTKNWPIIINNNGRVPKIFILLYKLYWFFLFSYREKYIMSNDIFYDELDNSDIYKVMIFFGFRRNKNKISKEINKKIREQYPEIETAWVSTVNEITPLNCNKGASLEFYVNYKGIDPNEVYVVGDSGNDIEMFKKYHKNSYCMRHSYPSVKKYATHQISRVYKLEKVLKGEIHE